MPITVTGPNGVTVNFPDGTDGATIDREMSKFLGGGNKEPGFGDHADALVQNFARGATFGYADELAAMAGEAMGKGKYQELVTRNRASDQEIERSMPITSTVGKLGGAIASPINKVVGGAASLLNAPKFANYAMQGAALGGLAGAGESTEGDKLSGAVTGAALGGALGAAVPAAVEGLGAGAKWVAGKISSSNNPKTIVEKLAAAVRKEAPSMSQEEIKAASQAAYKASEDAGVVVSPGAFSKFVGGLSESLDGFHPRIAPKTNDAIGVLVEEASSGKPITLEALDKLRQIVSGAAKTNDRNEVRLLSSLVGKIDEFIDDLAPDQLVAGNAETAVSSLKEARSLWRINTKLQNINDIVEIGDNLNDPQWVKNQFRMIVRKSKLFNKYSRDEQEVIKQISRTRTSELLARMTPLRGVQMAAPHIAQVGQDTDIATLQNLIARSATNNQPLLSGGGSNPLIPGPSPKDAFSARFGGYLGGLLGSNQ